MKRRSVYILAGVVALVLVMTVGRQFGEWRRDQVEEQAGDGGAPVHWPSTVVADHVTKAYAFQAPEEAALVLAMGHVRLGGPASIDIQQVAQPVFCHSPLDRPDLWDSDSFFCRWTRGDATWGTDWVLNVTATQDGEFVFGVYFRTQEELGALATTGA